MEKETQGDILEATGFIFRHPWIFLSSIIFIMIIVFTQLSYIQLFYQAKSIVSFEIISENSAGSVIGLDQKVNELTKRILVGESIDEIIREAWHDQKMDRQGLADMRDYLRSRDGIGISYDKESTFLTIDFRDPDPQLCYRVVKATIDTMRRENKKISLKRAVLGLDFLKEQTTYYKNKIAGIDREISQIKSDLKEKVTQLTEKDKMLLSEITGDQEFDIMEKTALQKFAKYDDKLVDLNLQLLEVEKKKESLEMALKIGDFSKGFKASSDFSTDVYINEYSRMIASKELEIANLRSQGYLPAHPEIIKREKEIKALEEIKNNKQKELKGISETRGSEIARKEGEEKIKSELDNINFQTSTIKDKIQMLEEQYEKDSGRKTQGDSSGGGAMVEEAATRLKELKKEKEIAEASQEEIRNRLEESEFRGRAEESEAGLIINVVEEPIVPVDPIPFQKTQKLIFGLLVAIFVGALIAYMIDSLDNSIRTASELRGLLGIPVLGSVDRISSMKEVRLKSFQRRAVAISWVIFALLSRVIGKIFFS